MLLIFKILEREEITQIFETNYFELSKLWFSSSNIIRTFLNISLSH